MNSNLCYDSVKIKSSWSWTPEDTWLLERDAPSRSPTHRTKAQTRLLLEGKPEEVSGGKISRNKGKEILTGKNVNRNHISLWGREFL